MRTAVGLSAALHAVLMAMMIFGLPWFLPEPPEPEPPPIVVELVELAEKSNPPPPRAQPKPEPPKPEAKPEVKPEPPKPEPPKPEAKAEPEPPKPEPPKAEPPKPEPPKPELAALPEPEPLPKPVEAPRRPEPPPLPKARPVVERKPEPPKPEPPKTEVKATDQIAALLNKIKPKAAQPAAEETAKPAPAQPAARSSSETSQLDQPLTMSEIDAIRAQIISNWFPPFGSKDAADMEVWIRISLNPDGHLVGRPEVVRGSQLAQEQFQPFVDSTVRAILKSQPLKVPSGKYQAFKDIEFRFNMRDMLRG